ncbi:MAG: SPOR domain-containing protein, partial [Saprospiraceae bacterium]|nr:SPOR domain-containing protein [Saprospiraceae bacterium]
APTYEIASPELESPQPKSSPETSNNITESPKEEDSFTAVEEEINWDNEGLFEFSVKKGSRQGYAIQTGVFAEYGNVLRQSANFEKKYGRTTLVSISQLGEVTVYRLMISGFDSRTQASEFLSMLRGNGIEGLVKDLSLL